MADNSFLVQRWTFWGSAFVVVAYSGPHTELLCQMGLKAWNACVSGVERAQV